MKEQSTITEEWQGCHSKKTLHIASENSGNWVYTIHIVTVFYLLNIISIFFYIFTFFETGSAWMYMTIALIPKSSWGVRNLWAHPSKKFLLSSGVPNSSSSSSSSKFKWVRPNNAYTYLSSVYLKLANSWRFCSNIDSKSLNYHFIKHHRNIQINK